MSRARKIARRTFLIGSAAVTGGVAFGAYWVARPHDNPLLRGLAAGEAAFNPWVKVTADTITLITPHADVGQGAVHMQALLLAEEMDLELGQFETSFGEPAPAYYNTVLAAEGAPFRTTDQGLPARASRSALGALGKVMGLQCTGGSSSVPDSFDKLREAGAMARETLKLAAAQMHGHDVTALQTEAGAVVLANGARVPYQQLAEVAATLEPVRDVALRPPEEWRLIGRDTMRSDIVAKSTGTQTYAIDLRLEGMVHAAVRLSPTRGPAVRAETDAAEQVAGVRNVLRISDGFAVVADNTWSAMQGARAIEVEWGPAPFHAEQEAHWAELSASITPDKLDAAWRSDGDVDTIGETGISAEYRAPYVAHQPLEPLNAIVVMREEEVEVWAAHQLPRFVQTLVAQVTGHAPDDVIFHNQYAGGSFGHRLEFENILCAAEIASQMRGTPVKLTYSREEDFARDFPRHIGLARARGAVSEGQVKSLSLEIAAPSVIASQMGRIGLPAPGPDSQLPAGAWNAPYAIDNFHVRTYRAANLAPVSSWRAVGASSCGFFLEGFLDELIREAGADPVEERLRLCSWDVARGVLEAVADMSGWGSDPGPRKGRGVALVESFGVPTAEVVEVTDTDEGIRIDKVWVAADVGRVVDPVSFENQVQGGVIWGLGHAINSEITFSEGSVDQTNYHDAEGLRLYQTPTIEVRGLEKNFAIRGIGEPPVPPAAPALANAIFDATGLRLREMPFYKFIDFL